jgi:hypothetical protein
LFNLFPAFDLGILLHALWSHEIEDVRLNIRGSLFGKPFYQSQINMDPMNEYSRHGAKRSMCFGINNGFIINTMNIKEVEGKLSGEPFTDAHG